MVIIRTAKKYRQQLVNYAHAVSGSAGRLVFSLVYFVLLANSLTIAEFGVFATCSALGVTLARLLGFGFLSPLYRVASTKPRLIGAYTSGMLIMSALSLPVIWLIGYFSHLILLQTFVAWLPFALIIIAEVVFWRSTEVVAIVNDGTGRFDRGAIIVIVGSALRSLAAIAFAFDANHSLQQWALYYCAINGVIFVFAVVRYYPRQKLHYAPALYVARLYDAVTVAGAELLFFLQQELDKFLVLSLGGPYLAGIYAIIMRLIDLTAIPIRAFNKMLVQHTMRNPVWIGSLKRKATIELAIFAASTLALLGLGTILYFYPSLLGHNVAQATPLLLLVLLVPGLRNLIEYQSELLYARRQTGYRMLALAILGAVKAAGLTLILNRASQPDQLVVDLNSLFVVLYLLSFALIYTRLRA